MQLVRAFRRVSRITRRRQDRTAQLFNNPSTPSVDHVALQLIGILSLYHFLVSLSGITTAGFVHELAVMGPRAEAALHVISECGLSSMHCCHMAVHCIDAASLQRILYFVCAARSCSWDRSSASPLAGVPSTHGVIDSSQLQGIWDLGIIKFLGDFCRWNIGKKPVYKEPHIVTMKALSPGSAVSVGVSLTRFSRI